MRVGRGAEGVATCKGGKKTTAVMRTCPGQSSAGSGSLLRDLERPVAPDVVPRVIQITSFAEHSNVILKFFAPKEQRFPKRPHTLRDLFVEINLP